MNKRLATRLYADADRLTRGSKYAAALALLDRLNAAFPDAQRIMYARAMCLAEVGRTAEGIVLCDRLIKQYGHKRAAALKSRIQQDAQVARVWDAGGGSGRSSAELEHMHIGEGPSAFTVAPAQSVPVWRSRRAWFIAGIVLLVIAAATGGGYYLYTQQDGVASAAGTETAVPSSAAPVESSATEAPASN